MVSTSVLRVGDGQLHGLQNLSEPEKRRRKKLKDETINDSYIVYLFDLAVVSSENFLL
jgi:hypothetical protein